MGGLPTAASSELEVTASFVLALDNGKLGMTKQVDLSTAVSDSVPKGRIDTFLGVGFTGNDHAG